MRKRPEQMICALVLCAMLPAAFIGCSRKVADEDVSALEVSRYRLNVDDAHRVARVMGEVRNGGETEVGEAVVIGALRGPGEEKYESGQTTIKDIPPGEVCLFTLRIDAKGNERDVEFFILSPAQAQRAAATTPVEE